MKVFLKTKSWLKVITDNRPNNKAARTNGDEIDEEALNVIVQTIDNNNTIYILTLKLF